MCKTSYSNCMKMVNGGPTQYELCLTKITDNNMTDVGIALCKMDNETTD